MTTKKVCWRRVDGGDGVDDGGCSRPSPNSPSSKWRHWGLIDLCGERIPSHHQQLAPAIQGWGATTASWDKTSLTFAQKLHVAVVLGAVVSLLPLPPPSKNEGRFWQEGEGRGEEEKGRAGGGRVRGGNWMTERQQKNTTTKSTQAEQQLKTTQIYNNRTTELLMWRYSGAGFDPMSANVLLMFQSRNSILRIFWQLMMVMMRGQTSPQNLSCMLKKKKKAE